MHAVAAFIRVVKGWVWQKYTYPVFVFVPLRLRAAKPANSQVVLCHMHVRYGRAISYTRNALLIDKQLPLLRQTVSSALMLCSLNNKIPRKKGAEKRPISGAGRRAVWIVHARSWAEFLSTNGRSDVRWRLRANERKVWERHAREAKALHAAWWENQKTIPRSCLAAVAVAEQGRQRLQRVAAYAPHGVIGPRPPVRCAPGPGRRPCPVTGARGGRAVISQPRCGGGGESMVHANAVHYRFCRSFPRLPQWAAWPAFLSLRQSRGEAGRGWPAGSGRMDVRLENDDDGDDDDAGGGAHACDAYGPCRTGAAGPVLSCTAALALACAGAPRCWSNLFTVQRM